MDMEMMSEVVDDIENVYYVVEESQFLQNWSDEGMVQQGVDENFTILKEEGVEEQLEEIEAEMVEEYLEETVRDSDEEFLDDEMLDDSEEEYDNATIDDFAITNVKKQLGDGTMVDPTVFGEMEDHNYDKVQRELRKLIKIDPKPEKKVSKKYRSKNIPCNICKLRLNDEYVLRKHIAQYNKNLTQPCKPSKIHKCIECDMFFRTNNYLIHHLKLVHNVETEVEYIFLNSWNEFDEWRDALELKNNFRYFRYTRGGHGHNKVLLKCSRSGPCRSTGPTTKEVSKKIGCDCTSLIRCKANRETGRVTVRYIKSHYGHTEFEPCFYTPVALYIARMLLCQAPFATALGLHTEAFDPDHIYKTKDGLVKRCEVQCVFCGLYFLNSKRLEKHLCKNHKKRPREDVLYFDTIKEFHTWRRQVQELIRCKFVLSSCYSVQTEYYECEISLSLTKDSCPARIALDLTGSRYKATYYTVHVGHSRPNRKLPSMGFTEKRRALRMMRSKKNSRLFIKHLNQLLLKSVGGPEPRNRAILTEYYRKTIAEGLGVYMRHRWRRILGKVDSETEDEEEPVVRSSRTRDQGTQTNVFHYLEQYNLNRRAAGLNVPVRLRDDNEQICYLQRLKQEDRPQNLDVITAEEKTSFFQKVVTSESTRHKVLRTHEVIKEMAASFLKSGVPVSLDDVAARQQVIDAVATIKDESTVVTLKQEEEASDDETSVLEPDERNLMESGNTNVMESDDTNVVESGDTSETVHAEDIIVDNDGNQFVIYEKNKVLKISKEGTILWSGVVSNKEDILSCAESQKVSELSNEPAMSNTETSAAATDTSDLKTEQAASMPDLDMDATTSEVQPVMCTNPSDTSLVDDVPGFRTQAVQTDMLTRPFLPRSEHDDTKDCRVVNRRHGNSKLRLLVNPRPTNCPTKRYEPPPKMPKIVFPPVKHLGPPRIIYGHDPEVERPPRRKQKWVKKQMKKPAQQDEPLKKIDADAEKPRINTDEQSKVTERMLFEEHSIDGPRLIYGHDPLSVRSKLVYGEDKLAASLKKIEGLTIVPCSSKNKNVEPAAPSSKPKLPAVTIIPFNSKKKAEELKKKNDLKLRKQISSSLSSKGMKMPMVPSYLSTLYDSSQAEAPTARLPLYGSWAAATPSARILSSSTPFRPPLGPPFITPSANTNHKPSPVLAPMSNLRSGPTLQCASDVPTILIGPNGPPLLFGPGGPPLLLTNSSSPPPQSSVVVASPLLFGPPGTSPSGARIPPGVNTAASLARPVGPASASAPPGAPTTPNDSKPTDTLPARTASDVQSDVSPGKPALLNPEGVASGTRSKVKAAQVPAVRDLALEPIPLPITITAIPPGNQNLATPRRSLRNIEKKKKRQTDAGKELITLDSDTDEGNSPCPSFESDTPITSTKKGAGEAQELSPSFPQSLGLIPTSMLANMPAPPPKEPNRCAVICKKCKNKACIFLGSYDFLTKESLSCDHVDIMQVTPPNQEAQILANPLTPSRDELQNLKDSIFSLLLNSATGVIRSDSVPNLVSVKMYLQAINSFLATAHK